MPMIRRSALVALLVLAAPAAAQAQATASCSVTSTSMSFGSYDGSMASPTVSTAIIAVTCLALDQPTVVTFSIALLGGTGGQGGRQLSSGAERLDFEIYTDANRSIVFGEGAGGTALLSGSGTASQVAPLRMNFTVYGRAPARQRAPRAGAYTEALTVLMTY
ncbi:MULTISPECIES: spore coat protein U domain-containing protein [Roseomonadaceae]|uniref:Spore coat protein U domain-containing protein n=1 Tax=Falsiroseomonas oleicola TaxID=2801474 RepID=A0ABS6H9K2_9PROT|nr:spore coat U domain-containing protein [Roseomonas oleicola]MBU8545387.1 spore coat protein U domain-containing protein [Roseomonas oleicola]